MPPFTAAKTERSVSKPGETATAVVTRSSETRSNFQLQPPSIERYKPLLQAAKQTSPCEPAMS